MAWMVSLGTCTLQQSSCQHSSNRPALRPPSPCPQAHIHYVHGSSFGNDEQPKLRNMKVRRRPPSHGRECGDSRQAAGGAGSGVADAAACCPALLQVVRDPYHITATFDLHNKPVNALWDWSKVRTGAARRARVHQCAPPSQGRWGMPGPQLVVARWCLPRACCPALCEQRTHPPAAFC